MPKPRVTGLLQNCALNSALAIVLQEISHLAGREAADDLAEINDNPIVVNYNRLKDIFSSYYRINPREKLTWVIFNDFLTNHSHAAKEIIFAPVFRQFIAEMGLADGAARPELLNNIQPDGNYITLNYNEAFNLFHNHLGISITAYEYEQDRHTENCQDNYKAPHRRPTTSGLYPFGAPPTLTIYFRDAHYEIQPFEDMAEPNRIYSEEIRALPPALSEIDTGINHSQRDYITNRLLRKLTTYVNEAIRELLGEPPAPQEAQSAADYAENCRHLHNTNTFAGKQDFAVRILQIARDNRCDRANLLLSHLTRLTPLARAKTPLATYLMNELATAIIVERANLESRRVLNVVADIERNQRACEYMTLQRSRELELIKAAKQTIVQAWDMYQRPGRGNKILIEVIKQTQLILLDPTKRNLNKYRRLQLHVEGKGSWGKTIAGLMLSVLGFALVIATNVVFMGATAPLTIPLLVKGSSLIATGISSMLIGVSFFQSGKNTGLYKKMEDLANQTESRTPDQVGPRNS